MYLYAPKGTKFQKIVFVNERRPCSEAEKAILATCPINIATITDRDGAVINPPPIIEIEVIAVKKKTTKKVKEIKEHDSQTE